MNSVNLIPTVEFSPFDFTENVKTPTIETPISWHTSWLAALAEVGITELTPITPQSWQVPIQQIRRPHTIKTLLACHGWEDVPEMIACRNVCELFDRTGPIAGGYVLKVNQEIVIKPGCCADLTAIDEWENALEGDANWQSLWNGHEPCLFSRCPRLGWIELAYDVLNLNAIKSTIGDEGRDPVQRLLLNSQSAPKIQAVLQIEELELAIHWAKRELIALEEAIKLVLGEFLPPSLLTPLLNILFYAQWPTDEQLTDLASGLPGWVADRDTNRNDDQ